MFVCSNYIRILSKFKWNHLFCIFIKRSCKEIRVPSLEGTQPDMTLFNLPYTHISITAFSMCSFQSTLTSPHLSLQIQHSIHLLFTRYHSSSMPTLFLIYVQWKWNHPAAGSLVRQLTSGVSQCRVAIKVCFFFEVFTWVVVYLQSDKPDTWPQFRKDTSIHQ